MSTLISNILANFQPGKIFNSTVRWASKKAGGSTKNRKGHAPGKKRGIKFQDGCRVTAGSILMRQLGVRLHPGQNVGIGKDGSLYAKQNGKVMITCEKFQPNFACYWTEKTYKERRDSMLNTYKKYFHVIPDPMETRFKLIDRI